MGYDWKGGLRDPFCVRPSPALLDCDGRILPLEIYTFRIRFFFFFLLQNTHTGYNGSYQLLTLE